VKNQIKRRSECGASLVEAVLLISLIAVIAVPAVTYLGEQPPDKLCNAAGKLFFSSPDSQGDVTIDWEFDPSVGEDGDCCYSTWNSSTCVGDF